MSDEMKTCPQCNSPYGYDTGSGNYECPECSHNWDPNEKYIANELVVMDANGNQLQDGDSVTITKNLPVKGFSHDIKIGTKVKNIRLVEGDHNIDCKIDGFGSMALKSEFVKKV
jgi:protein PhnA